MKAALKGSYVNVVIYRGIHERYPLWFSKEIYNKMITDESNFTFWIPWHSRTPDYHEKQLVEDFSVFLRKPGGIIHLTDYDTFTELYTEFTYDPITNSGTAALTDDCIDYVECIGGYVIGEYPDWFYEYFTEVINFPQGEESIFINGEDGRVSVTEHIVFMRNKFGEIHIMSYKGFNEMFDTDPEH